MMKQLNQPPVGANPGNEQSAAHYLQEMGHLLKEQIATPPAARERLVRTRFGQYIQSARQYHALSREALAVALGIQAAQIYALEEGLLPTTQIDATLLRGLGAVLDEDPQLLHQLLREDGFGRKSPPSTLRWLGWGRALYALLATGALTGRTILAACIVSITDSCLQSGRDVNLVNRLQASRLTLYVSTVVAALVLSFLTVRWVADARSSLAGFYFFEPVSSLVLGHSTPLLRTVGEQSRNYINDSLRSAESAVDAGLSRGQAPVPTAGAVDGTENYRILYARNQPLYKDAHTAYIAVDEAQIAIILLKVPVFPSPQVRCSNVGRFDLCPI